MLAEKNKPCPVTWRTEDGRGTWRCGLEEGHDGEHAGLGTGNGAYVRRIAERISENLCVCDGAVAWKSSENNKIQGWDESIAVLQELIAEVIVSAYGRLYADAVSTDVGCTLIGVFPNYSCEVEAITPRHVRFTVKQGSTICRIRVIELRRDGFIQTIHRVIPPGGAPYIKNNLGRQGGE